MGRIFRYLQYMAPGLAAGAMAWLLFRLFRREPPGGRLRSWTALLFWMYCGGMAAITLFREPGWLLSGLRGNWTPLFDLENLGSRVSLLPFSDIDSLYNVSGNIIMFVPFGFFPSLLRRGFTWRRALAVGLGITCGIECWQLLVGRTTDIDDIILNTLGVFCGYLLWKLLAKLAPGFMKRFQVWEI